MMIQYRYIKGKGWVPSSQNVLTIVCNMDGEVKRVVCTERQPVKGERVWFWYSDQFYRDHEDTEIGFLDNLIGFDGRFDNNGNKSSYKNLMGWVYTADVVSDPPSRKFVITVEDT